MRARTALVAAPAALALLANATSAGRGQELGDREAGRELAIKRCAECHDVGVGPRRTNDMGAPPFQVIANASETTAWRLRVMLQAPHPKMPMLVLTAKEIDDVSAYILGLKTR